MDPNANLKHPGIGLDGLVSLRAVFLQKTSCD